MTKAEIFDRWGVPAERGWGSNEEMGTYTSWTFMELPWEEELDITYKKSRIVHLYFRDDRVVGAVEQGRDPEPEDWSMKRLRVRAKLAETDWGPPTKTGLHTRSWHTEKGGYRVLLLPSSMENGTYRTVSLLGTPRMFSVLNGEWAEKQI